MIVRICRVVAVLAWLALATSAPARAETVELFRFVGEWEGPEAALVDFEDVQELGPPTQPPVDAQSPRTEVEPEPWEAMPEEIRATLDRAAWETLPPAERSAAVRGAKRFAGFSAQERTMWQARLERWNALPASERARVRERFAAWASLSAEDRAKEMQQKDRRNARRAETTIAEPRADGKRPKSARSGAQSAWKEDVPPERREAVRAHLKSLGREEKKELKQKLRAMTPEERRRHLATLGAP